MRRYNKKMPDQNMHQITRPFVFTWTICAECRDEVRWEKCYRYITGPYHGIMGGKTRHICTKCATSVDEVCNIIKERESILKNAKPYKDNMD